MRGIQARAFGSYIASPGIPSMYTLLHNTRTGRRTRLTSSPNIFAAMFYISDRFSHLPKLNASNLHIENVRWKVLQLNFSGDVMS